ncbi:MAG: hypothetical protein PUC72_07920 [Bacteroidales bacterium]|nr:hypothetical protein [Bacteroidales bacterium]
MYNPVGEWLLSEQASVHAIASSGRADNEYSHQVQNDVTLTI